MSHQCHPFHPGLAVAVVCLATSSGGGTTGDVSAVASPKVQTILALHIWPWTTPDSGRAASTHPADGTRQPHVGSAAHCQRTAAQAGPAGLAAYRAHVYPQASAPWSRPTHDVPALAYVRSPSRVGPHRPWRGLRSHPRYAGLRCMDAMATSAVAKTNRRERVAGNPTA